MERATSEDTWERVLEKIAVKVNSRSFKTWFAPTKLVREDDGGLTVHVPNDWFAEWLRSNYLGLIQDALKEIQRPGISVEFLSESRDVPPRPRGARPPRNGNGRTPGRGNGNNGHRPGSTGDAWRPWLNPRYTFDTFVVSSCNQFAHAAAMAVAEQPAGAYNPLYIYGGVGLGKTHLMQAIGNELLSRNSTDTRMRYISSEQFMNELINSIRFEKTDEFRTRYRNVDLLLIDDIQFLVGKERTQEEFFHTFNSLYDSQKQIVITSDVPPREIPTLEERLRSRFEWGLMADMQPPDLETKVAILRKKAEAEGTLVPDDVTLFIASSSNSNIRELEGALIRVIAYASMSGGAITLDLAKETLRDLLAPEPQLLTVEGVQKLVATYHNLKISELKSRNNSPQISFPRQIAMYLCKQVTSCSLPEIGKRFGGKHHSTVIHAINKVEQKRLKEKEFDRLIQNFLNNLK